MAPATLRAVSEAEAIDVALAGGGEMGALMRTIDWSTTPVGPVQSWPQSLRTALSILLETGFPMYIAWGPEFTQFYNDGYRPILGSTKHPEAMGISTRRTFAEIWNIIGPMFEGVMSQGRATTVVDFMLPLDRHGFVEECYFIFSYSPIRVESGKVGGVLVTVTETTERVLGARRLVLLQELSIRTQSSPSARTACAEASALFADHPDLPFALLYLLDADGSRATLAGHAGVEAGLPMSPRAVELDTQETLLPLRDAARGQPSLNPGSLVGGQAGVPEARQVLTLPIFQPGAERPLGILVVGTSPKLNLDEPYRRFLELVASQLGTSLSAARALEQARARAEALAEIDRAKTAFFGNVSHEFRTPLTLMLGPLEDALQPPGGELKGEALQTVHRNGLRLLKLVNSLLDFARIEAGRMQAAFEPVELGEVTRDLASSFRSATDRAGLRLRVDCPALDEPVYVDRDMWEKIVLNLLSNAFKYTLDGEIAVGLRSVGAEVELSVRDTGIGIAPHEQSRIFERFHRVQGARGRSFEGTGIGLALVQELARMHHGAVTVESEPGKGSTFRVRIPKGSAHLAPERLAKPGSGGAARAGAKAFVLEALQWVGADLPSEVPTVVGEAPAVQAGESALTGRRVLVVDDNADMRSYLRRILEPLCQVELAHDGQEALERIRAAAPDLVLTDVMMPRLDGFGLLRALREAGPDRALPVVMLSARAGEEAHMEGLRAGADDYLVKPFSARELVARLEVQLTRARLQQLSREHAQRLNRIFESAPVGILVLHGPEHRIDSANADYLKLVGGRELVGKTVREAFPELESQGIYQLLDDVYRTARPHVARSLPVTLINPDGESKQWFFDFVYQPIRDAKGQVEGIIAVVFDVSELALAKRAAEAASQAKDEFMAVLGHELRNPLAPIVTALELMAARAPSQQLREREIISRQVAHLTRLVDDLLDVSRVARGRIELNRERLELSAIVERSLEQMSALFGQRRQRVDVRVPRGLEVDGDPVRLAQVVTNLLNNASKYTEPSGRIEVEGSLRDGKVVLQVRDDGVGISPAMLPRIFDMFVQERQSIDRSQGGLGLGLTIVKSLVELHGGTVTATSAGRGQGSCFTVELPQLVAAEGSARREPQRHGAAGAGKRVLIVDDNFDAAEMLAEYLQLAGYDTRVAHDGRQALELVGGWTPDLGLLDIGLPEMNGYDLAVRLRNAIPGRLPLVAISGYGQPDDHQRARAAGFDLSLVKPVRLHELSDQLTRLLRAGSGSRADLP